MLTPWCWVILEKLMISDLVKNAQNFIEPQGSLPHSQKSASSPYLSQLQSLPSSRILKVHFNFNSHLRQGLRSGLFPSGFYTKVLYEPALSPVIATCTAQLIFYLITRLIFGGSTDRKALLLCCILHFLSLLHLQFSSINDVLFSYLRPEYAEDTKINAKFCWVLPPRVEVDNGVI